MIEEGHRGAFLFFARSSAFSIHPINHLELYYGGSTFKFVLPHTYYIIKLMYYMTIFLFNSLNFEILHLLGRLIGSLGLLGLDFL